MRAFRLQSLRGLRQAQSRFSRQSSWVCPGCRVSQASQHRWSSDSSSLVDKSKEKPYYITTPIFYVNAAPHIGHLYTMVLADVLKRWQQINGREALLCTGTDEHGMKIQQAAAKEGMPPKEFCDNNASKFRDLAQVANISHDFFIRTTDEDHKLVVEQFWLLLKTRAPEGLGLYKGKHEGWYCVSDECFYPEDLVQPSVVPQTGRKIMASVETGNEVEWVTEDTWFFPLSKYKEKLLKFYDENPDWIQPAHRMNEVRNWVENHLEDLSITRPASRLSWGIKDPEDPSNTIYVWVDALINYLTKAGFGSQWQVNSADKGIWPADVQVVGKDIIRFHAVYWPALLMAVGLPLPKKIVCHNHWTMSNRKMSKSLGNVVNPFFAVQRWNLDPLRYFLMRNGSFKGDMSYANDFIIVAYEKELQANIGNLFNRISRNKTGRWSTLEAAEYAREGKFDNIAGLAAQGSDQADLLSLEPTLEAAPEKIRNEMDEINLSGALREVFELLRETNRFITDAAPWQMVKETGSDARVRLNWVIYRCAEALRIAGILLQPVMPTKAGELLDGLGVKPERRTVEFAAKGADVEYGVAPLQPQKLGDSGRKIDPRPDAWASLFPPVSGIELPDYEAVTGKAAPKPKGAISTPGVLLVPYESHHSFNKADARKDIQEATASEPMTLEEEYENQLSWRTSSDKLTFIVCAPLEGSTSVVKAGTADADELMRGDINFFLHTYEADDEAEAASAEAHGWLTGEVDVMIASLSHRGRGMGRAAVQALLTYLQKHMAGMLDEYDGGGGELKGLMVKIKEGNAGSRALFEKLGFEQRGGVNYFGEVVMVKGWDDVVSGEVEYEELRYEGIVG
ncbi:hypothetical protein ACHAPT_003904 [Fusarium lateritium]